MKKLLLLATTLTLTSSVFGETKITNPDLIKYMETGKVHSNGTVSSNLQTSTVNREGKKFSVDAGILGLSYNSPSVELKGSYFIKPNLMAFARYSDLRNLEPSNSDNDEFYDSKEENELWDENGKGYALNVGVKSFNGNSFYFEPSVYYRKQKVVQETTTVNSVLISSKSGDITDIGVSIRIGNQWQWDSFTIGCDWIGLTQSLSDLDSNGNLDSDEYGSLSLLNLYLGASF